MCYVVSIKKMCFKYSACAKTVSRALENEIKLCVDASFFSFFWIPLSAKQNVLRAENTFSALKRKKKRNLYSSVAVPKSWMTRSLFVVRRISSSCVASLLSFLSYVDVMLVLTLRCIICIIYSYLIDNITPSIHYTLTWVWPRSSTFFSIRLAQPKSVCRRNRHHCASDMRKRSSTHTKAVFMSGAHSHVHALFHMLDDACHPIWSVCMCVWILSMRTTKDRELRI